jgi:hypothetical protein
MTVRELIVALQALAPEYQELPIVSEGCSQCLRAVEHVGVEANPRNTAKVVPAVVLAGREWAD